MNTDMFPVLVADVAQCMQQNISQLAEDYYLDLHRLEVVAVHFFHHWLYTDNRKPGALLLPGADPGWSKGCRAVTEMQQHPGQFARIPRIKSSVRKAFMLDLAERFPQVRAELLARLGHLEAEGLGYDFTAWLKAVKDPSVKEKIQGQVGEFFLQMAQTWLAGRQCLAA